MDIELLDRIGEEFYNRFKEKKINKVLTIEASGIAIACFVAKYFGVPLVFAKTTKPLDIIIIVVSNIEMHFFILLSSLVYISAYYSPISEPCSEKHSNPAICC